MKKTILVVDDDKTNLRIIQMNLSQYGYKVYTVENGMEALSFLKEQMVDLILLDIEMPIMNGMKTLKLIRKIPSLAAASVMFLTASADSNSVVEACRLEAVDYVIKPFVPGELYIRVERVLRENRV